MLNLSHSDGEEKKEVEECTEDQHENCLPQVRQSSDVTRHTAQLTQEQLQI